MPSSPDRLREVTLTLCEACIEGAGGECHTPGCALWMNRAPDVPIQQAAYEPSPASERAPAVGPLSVGSAKRAVFDGVSGFCAHSGEPIEGEFCCPECERIADEVLHRLARTRVWIEEREVGPWQRVEEGTER